MKLSNTTEYALRILIHISKDSKQLFQTKELATELQISYKYLSKVITLLVKGNLIYSKKGKNGGIALAKNPNEIKLKDILILTNDIEQEDKCILGLGKCNGSKKCALHDSWKIPKNIK